MAFIKPEKAFCVLELTKTKSCTFVWSAFRIKFLKEELERKCMKRWHGSLWKHLSMCIFFQKTRMNLSLKQQKLLQLATTDNAMLERVWQGCRLDVSHVTSCDHIEHLWTFYQKNLRLQAFRIYKMHCYILNSFWDIHCQNEPKTIGTPWFARFG